MRSACLLIWMASAAAAAPPSHKLEGAWEFHMVRPAGAMPRTCQAQLELQRAGKNWSGAIRFRRILGGRQLALADLSVKGKGFKARLDDRKFRIELEGALRGSTLAGRLDWKGYDSFEWSANRPGTLFEPGLEFDRDLPRGDAAKLGMDAEALAALVSEARRAYSDALVIVKDGRVVCERTFGHPGGRIETMSVTKFVTAIGVAMLLEEGKIPSLDTPLSSFFPSWSKGPEAKVTLRHVLTHTSGIRHEKMAWKLNKESDRVRYVLGNGVATEPGTQHAYNNDAVALLAGVFPKTVGKQLDEYVGRRLFRPLGIRDWEWGRDGEGTTCAYAELRLGARDLARIGMLVANGGRVGSRKILSQEWLTRLARPATPLKPDQGLLWRLFLDGRKGVYHTGWLGQWLIVCPSEKLVAVRLRRFEDQSETDRREYEFGKFARLLRSAVR
ncbi:MAG: serine hydrolase domain-containing protein [Planctomycetota bacterium]|jgi:CubicO group peptidase (beta-lactamase class C family)